MPILIHFLPEPTEWGKLAPVDDDRAAADCRGAFVVAAAFGLVVAGGFAGVFAGVFAGLFTEAVFDLFCFVAIYAPCNPKILFIHCFDDGVNPSLSRWSATRLLISANVG